jgi:hypothetical protein
MVDSRDAQNPPEVPPCPRGDDLWEVLPQMTNLDGYTQDNVD